MSYELEDKLVIGIASSALFDLSESDRIFREKGEEAYREYQQEHLEDPLEPGVAFAFIKRLLSLNDLSTKDPLVEVIVLSHNSPDTGLRVLQSTKTHKLGITRAVFTQGKAPFEYMTAFNMSLFLSANKQDVVQAARAGFPAGQVIGETPVKKPIRTPIPSMLPSISIMCWLVLLPTIAMKSKDQRHIEQLKVHSQKLRLRPARLHHYCED